MAGKSYEARLVRELLSEMFAMLQNALHLGGLAENPSCGHNVVLRSNKYNEPYPVIQGTRTHDR